MHHLAARIILWGIAGSLAVVAGSAAILLWLERSANFDGPGPGVGLTVLAGSLLSLFGVLIVLSTVVLGVLQMRRRVAGAPHITFVFASGIAYTILAVLLAFSWLR